MAPPAVATPTLLSDPGWLFWAPLLSTIPTNTAAGSVFTDSWPVAWLPLGATVEGSTLSYEINVEAMSVAELFDPVKYATTSRTGSIAFALASWTLTNLKRVLNGGTITTTGTGATSVNSYAFPTAGQEVRCMIGWEAADSTARIVIPQAISSGTVEMAFQKAPDFAQLPATFNMELASGATQPFNVYTAGVARA